MRFYPIQVMEWTGDIWTVKKEESHITSYSENFFIIILILLYFLLFMNNYMKSRVRKEAFLGTVVDFFITFFL